MALQNANYRNISKDDFFSFLFSSFLFFLQIKEPLANSSNYATELTIKVINNKLTKLI